MKDIVITSKRIKNEMVVFTICIVFAIISNIYSIVVYNTNWNELYTQLPFLFAIATFIYIIGLLLRGMYCVAKKAFRK